MVVGGGWWLVIGGWWRLAAVGSWWRLAVGGPLGRSLRAILNKKKMRFLKDRPGDRCRAPCPVPPFVPASDPAGLLLLVGKGTRLPKVVGSGKPSMGWAVLLLSAAGAASLSIQRDDGMGHAGGGEGVTDTSLSHLLWLISP